MQVHRRSAVRSRTIFEFESVERYIPLFADEVWLDSSNIGSSMCDGEWGLHIVCAVPNCHKTCDQQPDSSRPLIHLISSGTAFTIVLRRLDLDVSQSEVSLQTLRTQLSCCDMGPSSSIRRHLPSADRHFSDHGYNDIEPAKDRLQFPSKLSVHRHAPSVLCAPELLSHENILSSACSS